MIRLYDKTGEKLLADITENSIEYIVEEERNGLFELKLIYPAGYNNYNDLIKENILITNATNTLLNQKFRIYNTRKTFGNKIEVYARHISYDLLSDFIENLDIENQSCEYCLNQLFLNSQFSRYFKGVSDIINVQNFKVSRSNLLNAIAGQQGSIIDTFGTGAEILRDNETIKVLNRRGHDNGVVIEYGENMTGFDCEEDTTDLITRIYPYVKKSNNNTEDIITLTEKFVDSPRINNYSHPYIASIDLSDKFEQDEEITQSKLKLETEKYFIKTKCDIPKMNFKINFVLIKKLGLNLCDLVTIKHKLYGIDTQAKVIKAVYNPRIERYESMELGEPKASLGDLISSGGSNDSGNNEEENKPPIIDDNNFPNTLPNIPILSGKAIGLGSIELTWTFENKIFYKYELYASKVKDFSPNVFDLIFKGQVSNFLHVVKPNEVWYYRVRAVNSHGKTTEFSTQVKVETQKNDDFEVYFSGLAVENLVANIFSVDYMKAAIIKGQWVDAKQLSVTDGNGKRTLDIDSFGRVRLNVTELSILSKAVETEESSTLKINNAKAEAINSATVDTNKKISNLQIGIRNILLNTALKDSSNFSIASGTTINTLKKTPAGNNSFYTNLSGITTDVWRGVIQNVNLNKIELGKEYTFSCRILIETNHNLDSNLTMELKCLNSSGALIISFRKSVDKNKLNEWQDLSVTGIIPEDTAKIECRYWVQRNGKCYAGDFLLEKGNKKSDWIPALEDTSKEILDITTEKVNQAKADIKVTTDAITQKVNKVESTTTTLNEYVTNHESRITSAEQKITSEAIISTVSATVNQAKNDAINSTNNSTDNKLKNYTTKSEFTELKQTADSISSRVERTEKNIDEIYENTDSMNNWISNIEQKADKINLEVKKKVGSNEIISTINMSSEAVKIAAKFLELTGYATFRDLASPGETIIDGRNIKSGFIEAIQLIAPHITGKSRMYLEQGSVFSSDGETNVKNFYGMPGGTFNVESEATFRSIINAARFRTNGNYVPFSRSGYKWIIESLQGIGVGNGDAIELQMVGGTKFGVDLWWIGTRTSRANMTEYSNALDVINKIKHITNTSKNISEICEFDESTIPEQFTYDLEQDNGDIIKQVSPKLIIPYLTAAIQEQHKHIETLEYRIEKLEKIIENQL